MTIDSRVGHRRALEHDGYRAQVDAVLDGFFDEAKARASRIGEAYLLLWQTLEANTIGGKRFRPRMVMTAYEGLGGERLETAAHVGAAFELLHTALIVHDDVIDRDFVRRGVLNVSGSYRERAQTAGIPIPAAEHRGMSVGVVAGDLALSGAYRLIERSPVHPITKTRLLDLLEEAVFASAAGELMDVDFSLNVSAASVDEVLAMERLKTAVYSFEVPLKAGAVLAGRDEPTVELLGEVGRDLGIAYQIVDDILGVFGDSQSTGKTTLGDLREGKRTVLMAYAATRPEWSEISGCLGNPDLPAEDAELVRGLLLSSGAESFARALARDFANRAWSGLQSPLIADRLRDQLAPVVASVLERTS
jgi:geranylgeranyl diphosphate synthase type II